MRILGFIALATMLTMCKAKKTIEVAAPIIYTVLLQKDVSPKELIRNFSHEISDFSQSSRTENQWRMIFKNEGTKSETIKRDLLNSDLVISAYDGDYSGPVNSKNTVKGKTTIRKQ